MESDENRFAGRMKMDQQNDFFFLSCDIYAYLSMKGKENHFAGRMKMDQQNDFLSLFM